jgi:hypothetical protein
MRDGEDDARPAGWRFAGSFLAAGLGRVAVGRGVAVRFVVVALLLFGLVVFAMFVDSLNWDQRAMVETPATNAQRRIRRCR